MKRALLILSMAATLLLPFAVVTSNLLQAQITSKTLQTWDDIKGVYSTPEWFTDGKFGIMMHWGIYSVPARQSEWYVRYMYGGNEAIMRDHIAKYGPLDKFGYKDFIPMFTAAKWNPDAWAELFKKSGAKYIVPSAEHHDGFSLWNSALNKYNAKNMGPKRDLIGDLAKAVREKGLKFGVSNHSSNHFNFIPLVANSDQTDPAWSEFYQADRSREARVKFRDTWIRKNYELIDQYQPDMLWFDGIGSDASDSAKLQVAAHYFNKAQQWKKQVTISGKYTDFPSGRVLDYERQGRIHPRGIKDFAWQVDDPMGHKFAYVENIMYKDAGLMIRRLVDCVSMNGNYLLNISPMADGTIPQPQQERLLAIGKWLDINGEAIYGTKAWTRYGEGPYYDAAPAEWKAPGPDDPPHESFTGKEIRFTTKGTNLYAIIMDWPGEQAIITSLPQARGSVKKIELLGHKGQLKFTQDAQGLKVQMPASKPCDYAYALKITGLNL
jgi:alpha-L-fucosidase